MVWADCSYPKILGENAQKLMHSHNFISSAFFHWANKRSGKQVSFATITFQCEFHLTLSNSLSINFKFAIMEIQFGKVFAQESLINY